jgi:hypothetical protein
MCELILSFQPVDLTAVYAPAIIRQARHDAPVALEKDFQRCIRLVECCLAANEKA